MVNISSHRRTSETYLIEGTIASVENILKGDVGAILDTTNVCIVEVERDAKPAFARSTGKVPHDLLSSRRIGEIVKGRRVLYSGNYNGNCITESSKHMKRGGLLSRTSPAGMFRIQGDIPPAERVFTPIAHSLCISIWRIMSESK